MCLVCGLISENVSQYRLTTQFILHSPSGRVDGSFLWWVLKSLQWWATRGPLQN